MASFPQFWSDLAGVAIPSSIFWAFVGSGKILCILGIWGLLGNGLKTLMNLLLLFPPTCGGYMHHKQGDSIIPCVISVILIIVLLMMPEPTDQVSDDKQKPWNDEKSNKLD